MKIFYSWQSDSPSKVGRAFIRDALENAIASLDIDEADRPEIDQDTKGVLGSPAIAETILLKIRNASVVVADVTLTGTTPDGKRLINSNIAIELGYALGHHGDTILLKVMNTFYGSPEELPFDLRHRRWPLQFRLDPDAEPQIRREIRDTLAKDLGKILRAHIDANKPQKHLHIPKNSTHNPAAYWRDGEVIVPDAYIPSSKESRPLSYLPNVPLAYLRIWPSEPIAPLSIDVLFDYAKTSIEPLGASSDGWSNSRNKYGLVTYGGVRTNGALGAITQIFRNGEIWGVNQYWLRQREGMPKFIPTEAFERGLTRALNTYISTAKTHFGYQTEINVEAGLVNIGNFRLANSQGGFEEFAGPIYEDVTVRSVIRLDEPKSVTDALLTIFNRVFESAGQNRPPNLYNFPPINE